MSKTGQNKWAKINSANLHYHEKITANFKIERASQMIGRDFSRMGVRQGEYSEQRKSTREGKRSRLRVAAEKPVSYLNFERPCCLMAFQHCMNRWRWRTSFHECMDWCSTDWSRKYENAGNRCEEAVVAGRLEPKRRGHWFLWIDPSLVNLNVQSEYTCNRGSSLSKKSCKSTYFNLRDCLSWTLHSEYSSSCLSLNYPTWQTISIRIVQGRKRICLTSEVFMFNYGDTW